jgi:DNA polymerase-3 subunit alpha/error-prone DNA polymerase
MIVEDAIRAERPPRAEDAEDAEDAKRPPRAEDAEDAKRPPRLLIADNVNDIPESYRLPELPEESEIERLRRQYSVLGFLCDRHPIVFYNGAVEKRRPVKAVDIRKHAGKRIRFAGWMITGKTVMTKYGETMKFLTFEDETGIIETVFFPKAYERFCSILEYDKPYIIEGRVDRDDPGGTGVGAITISVESAKAL